VFLAAIRDTGNVRLAAQAAGIDRTTPYVTARRDPAFAAAWQAAEQDAIDILEATARKRALESSDQLLMFLLKAHRPERYRDRLELRLELRREAERLAAMLGMTPDQVLAEAERRAAELGA
jgi:hypothetical protein